MCHMWLVMSTGFHAELHRRRCGVVVRSRCQDMEARAAGGLGWGSGCNGGRWEAILSENPTFWQWTLSSLKIIYIAVVEALLRWDMAISCHVLRGIGAALWDLRMLVSMGYLALDLMRSLQSCWVNTTDRLTVKRQILSLVRSHCSSSYFDTSRVWGTMPQELLLVIALPHLLRRAE